MACGWQLPISAPGHDAALQLACTKVHGSCALSHGAGSLQEDSSEGHTVPSISTLPHRDGMPGTLGSPTAAEAVGRGIATAEEHQRQLLQWQPGFLAATASGARDFPGGA